MKNKIVIVVFIVINLFIMFITYQSMILYLSLFKNLPWYEPSGIQFLAVYFVIPFYLLSAIALVFLNHHFPVSFFNRIIPVISSILIVLPVIIDGSISSLTQIIGFSISLILLYLIIEVTVKTLIFYFRVKYYKD